MKTIRGEPLLWYHIKRLKKAIYPVFVATTSSKSDDAIEVFCRTNNIPFFRGDEFNVLERYHHCAKKYNIDPICRVTSDCPLIDGKLVKEGIDQFISIFANNLYLSNDTHLPNGMGYEVFSQTLLRQAWQNAQYDYELEHVTPYMYQNQFGNLRLVRLMNGEDNSRYRITVDTVEDFELIRCMIEDYRVDEMGYREIIRFLKKHPELVVINAHVKQKQLGG